MRAIQHFFLVAAFALLPLSASAQLAVDAGEDVVLECESGDGAEYTLNGSVPEGDDIVFGWSTVPEVDLEDDDTLTPTGEFPLGETTVTLDAEDTVTTESGSDSVTVTVQDTTPPVVRTEATPFVLWPPNHAMREVEVEIKVRDRCGDADSFDVVLIAAESNEPDNSKGDGNTTDDIQGASIGEDDRSVLLRAERSGNGSGRVYTLTYRLTDGSGNETEAEVKVYVPHDFSDVKDRLGDMGGDRDEMEPICPSPAAAAGEFVDAVPEIGIYPDAESCIRACQVWTRGCRGIVNGTAKCIRSEMRSLLQLGFNDCRSLDDRSEVRECKAELKGEAAGYRARFRQSVADGGDTCESIDRRCTNACEGLHDENGADYDDEGVGED